MRNVAAITAAMFLLASSQLLIGCTQTQSTATPSTAQQRDFSTPRGGADGEFSGALRHVPVTTSRVGADLFQRHSVPYDNMSLPLVSPDGRFIATQTRIGPDWPTILAEHEAYMPVATRIEIYGLPHDGSSPQFVAELEEPALLGRSYDANGFLIESPREDGSRWIGYVSWESGTIHWLVADAFVNAFPALGPDGRLAWSRRDIDAEDDQWFSLVIRKGSSQWEVEADRESWLMPTWSWRGDGLFVLSLADGHLEAVHAVASSAAAFRQSRQRIGLAREANIFNAYQTIGAQVCAPVTRAAGAPREQFIFFHPSMMRMAVWRPGGGRAAVSILDRLSYAAVMHDGDYAIVSTEKHLLLRHIQRERDHSELLAGMYVARITPANSEWPYVLLAPGDGDVALYSMRALGAGQLANQ